MLGTFGAFNVNRAISTLIHGSEMVAVAQRGLVEYWDALGGFSRLYDKMKISILKNVRATVGAE